MTVNEINRKLKEEFGDDLIGNPNFRVVWSDDQREHQCGEWEEFCGPIYLRSFKGVKEVQKYPWIEKKWILEKLMGNPDPYTILGTKHSYECIYVFQDKNQNWLPVKWEICWIVIQTLLNGRFMTPGQREEVDQKAFKDEISQFEAYLDEDQPSELSVGRLMGSTVFLNTPRMGRL